MTSRLLIFFALTLSLNLAQAALQCSATECVATAMPLLNQHESSVQAKFGNNACTPTSTEMVLEEIFSFKKDVESGSFTQRLYQQNPYQGILTLGADMGTTAANGTYINYAMNTLEKVRLGFVRDTAKFNFVNSSTNINPGMILNNMKSRHIGSFMYGIYKPSCTTLASGRKSCSFTRQGGHSVAVQRANASMVYYNNPENSKSWTAMSPIQSDANYKNVTLSMPSMFPNNSARLLYGALGTVNNVRLIEYFFGLQIL